MNIIKKNKEMTVADEELLTILDKEFNNYLNEDQLLLLLLLYDKKRRSSLVKSYRRPPNL